MTVARPSPRREPPPAAAFAALDALRGVAIVAVVGMHVTSGFVHAAPRGSPAMWEALALHLFTSFATPLFLAVSMASLALGYDRPLRLDGSYASFLARRARRVLPAYVGWTVLTLLRSDPAALASRRLVGHLLRGSAAYHLYFVPLIVTYYVFWPVLSRLAVEARRDGRLAAAIAATGLVVSAVVWRALPATSVTTPLFWLGYATVGLAAAPWLVRLGDDRPIGGRAIGPLAALVAATAFGMIRHVTGQLVPVPDGVSLVLAATIFQIPIMAYTLAAMALAAWLVGTRVSADGVLARLGRHSYGVYLAHVLVLEVVVHRLLGRPADADFGSAVWVVALVVQWGLCLALTWGLVAGLARMPLLAPLAGERSPSAR